MNANADDATDNLRDLIDNAEEMLRSVSGQSEESLAKLRDRVEASVRSAKDRLSEIEVRARTMTNDAAATADSYVKENPWGAVAIAAAAGVILGALLGRRM